MFITGPDVIRTVTGEEVDIDTLGGAETHAARSGVAHFVAEDEDGALALAKQLLSYLPSNNADDPPTTDTNEDVTSPNADALDNLIPAKTEEAYDIREAISLMADP